ncbi:hypothetical protein [Moorena sp. SIO3I6]|uniref:hypothetical protein n=1 Tax=Moorena sp. SIO3I6 TaxID=2607831 RepID=UPI0013F77595|nr:hypothetical protein [Moorena sp. SIO3I6]
MLRIEMWGFSRMKLNAAFAFAQPGLCRKRGHSSSVAFWARSIPFILPTLLDSRFPIPDSRFPTPYSLLPTPYS